MGLVSCSQQRVLKSGADLGFCFWGGGGGGGGGGRGLIKYTCVYEACYGAAFQLTNSKTLHAIIEMYM